MRTLKFLILLIASLDAVSSNGQVIRGTVMDAKSLDTLAFASVFIESTFIGTSADQNGYFSIDLNGRPFMPLTVSAIGYYSASITEYSTDIHLKVYLVPKIYRLKEVVISAVSLEKERKKDLKIFRDVFLGTSANATRCSIINENDITFNYDSDSDTLRAYAGIPLHIRNPMLGYSITYYLDNFEYNRITTDYSIKGVISFEEDFIDLHSKNRVERRRDRAYQGSIRHFINSMWNDDLKYFRITSLDGTRFNPTDSVRVLDSTTRYLQCHQKIYIRYAGKLSVINPLSDKLRYDQFGLYLPDIKWEGEMASRRVGDWLPIEYHWNK